MDHSLNISWTTKEIYELIAQACNANLSNEEIKLLSGRVFNNFNKRVGGGDRTIVNTYLDVENQYIANGKGAYFRIVGSLIEVSNPNLHNFPSISRLANHLLFSIEEITGSEIQIYRIGDGYRVENYRGFPITELSIYELNNFLENYES